MEYCKGCQGGNSSGWGCWDLWHCRGGWSPTARAVGPWNLQSGDRECSGACCLHTAPWPLKESTSKWLGGDAYCLMLYYKCTLNVLSVLNQIDWFLVPCWICMCCRTVSCRLVSRQTRTILVFGQNCTPEAMICTIPSRSRCMGQPGRVAPGGMWMRSRSWVWCTMLTWWESVWKLRWPATANTLVSRHQTFWHTVSMFFVIFGATFLAAELLGRRVFSPIVNVFALSMFLRHAFTLYT